MTIPVFKVPSFAWHPYQGCYGGLSGRYLSWYGCRDSYHSEHKRPARLLFVAYEGHTVRVMAFISRAEQILKLPVDQKSSFQKTNMKGTLYVKIGKFWTKEQIRMSLFTILLRASRYYKTRNFYKAAKTDPYLISSWPAFQRFMRGHTDIRKSKYGGWLNYFHSECNVDKLTKPE